MICFAVWTWGWGWGVVQHVKINWTQLDLMLCENERLKRSKINENGGQLDWKSRKKFIQNASNLSTNTFWWKIRPTLGPSISGTKCDRDNRFFLQKEGVNLIVLGYKIGTPSDWKSPKWGHHRRTSLPCSQSIHVCENVFTPPPQQGIPYFYHFWINSPSI